MTTLHTNPWLKLATKPCDLEWNLLCFPFAAGYAEYFLPWGKKLDRCGFYPIQLPGRSYRWQEQPFVEIDRLIDALVEELMPIISDAQPYVLFGHSMGGYIAYCFAKKIKALGLKQPQALIVSAVPAPAHWVGRKKLSDLSPDAFREFFIELGGFHHELLKHESFIEQQLNILRHDILLCESCCYEGSAQFTFPILSLSAKNDAYVLHEHMQLWEEETSSTFQLQEVEGDHFYLNEQVDKVISLIKQYVNYN